MLLFFKRGTLAYRTAKCLLAAKGGLDMLIDVMGLLLSLIVFCIYGSICLIALVFTFSLDTYIKIHDALNFNLFSSPILSPIEKSIDWFDTWAMKNNIILGPVLIVLSLIDLRLFFEIIWSF